MRRSVSEGRVVRTQQLLLLALFTVVVVLCNTVKGGGIYRGFSSGGTVVFHSPFKLRLITDL
jgi:hypothetical protein